MTSKIAHTEKAKINVRDEKELKLWIKIIASVYKNGGDISKLADILWRSFDCEIQGLEQKIKSRKKVGVLPFTGLGK